MYVDAGLRLEDPEDMDMRRQKYSSNFIPPKTSKMFVWFIWDAIQDATLIILLVAALVSLGVSFYHPPQQDDDEADGK